MTDGGGDGSRTKWSMYTLQVVTIPRQWAGGTGALNSWHVPRLLFPALPTSSSKEFFSMEKVSTQLGRIKEMLVGREKDPTQHDRIEGKLDKTSAQLNRIEENLEDKPNLSSRSAEKATDNASFKPAKDGLDGRAEERLWECVEEQEWECVWVPFMMVLHGLIAGIARMWHLHKYGELSLLSTSRVRKVPTCLSWVESERNETGTVSIFSVPNSMIA